VTSQQPGDGPAAVADVGPAYRVRQLSIEDGMAIASWRMPGAWAVHDALQAPRDDEGYWAVEDQHGRLVGYCCFGEAARVAGLGPDSRLLDVVLGLRPDLIGRGLSAGFARTVVAHAHEVAGGRRLRTVVARDNVPGRRAAEGAGFSVTGAYEVPGGAAVSSYLVMTRS
jgi:RimJ/RimL family protein N-acetyltransferase